MGHAPEKPVHHHLCLAGVPRPQATKRLVERQQRGAPILDGDFPLPEGEVRRRPAPLFDLLVAKVVHQDLSHRPGGEGLKVGLILPGDLRLVDELQVGTDTYAASDYSTSTSGPDPKTVTFTPQASVTRDDDVIATATDANGNTSEFSGMSQPLPVELAAFEASLTEGGAARLSWKTLSEEGNARFVVERRTEAQQERAGAWEQITTVESQAPGGTSTEALSYSFTDRALPFEAQRLTYRLVQHDIDGSATVLAEQAVEVGGPERFALHGSFPNPFQGQTTIRYELPEEREVTVAVYDARGRKVRTLLRGEAQSGRQETTFAAEGLASGVYFVRMRAGDFSATRKVVLVR